MKIVRFGNGWNALRRNFLCIPFVHQYLDIVDIRNSHQSINWRFKGNFGFDDCLQSYPDIKSAADDYYKIIAAKKAARIAKRQAKKVSLVEIVNPSICDKIQQFVAKLVGKAA